MRDGREDLGAIDASICAANMVHPAVLMRAVADPAILDQGRVFAEAMRQTQPLALTGSADVPQLVRLTCEGTANVRGMTTARAEQLITSGQSLPSLVAGKHPIGKAAEIVTAADYRDLHAGLPTRIVHPPEHIAHNVADIRLPADVSSHKDLLFAFETKNGNVIWKYNGQVKTGSPQYVADSLFKMANGPAGGKIGYVDPKFVNPDGTPRVAPDAFTEGQARRLQQAKVRLRGIPDMEKRAGQLNDNIAAHGSDGLDPVAREQLAQRRADIVQAYARAAVLRRIAVGASIGAGTAALASAAMQLISEDRTDYRSVGKAACTGAAFGAGGAAMDAGLYRLAVEGLEMAPEAAKTFARQGVAAGFCAIAVAGDLFAEHRAFRRGEITRGQALGGAVAKTALNLLPLVMAPLGFAGLPLLIGAQLGGRWLLQRSRTTSQPGPVIR